MSLTLTACGGADTVTGANFLLEVEGCSLLVDCGLTQGEEACGNSNYKPFSYDPKKIRALFVTHAHLDHIGRIPKLVKDGFTGPIYATPPTLDLTRLMLEDSLGILEKEALRKKRAALFSKEDVRKAAALFRPLPYHKQLELPGGLSVMLRDAGHILGSAMVEVACGEKKVVLSGDLGNSPSPFLQDTEEITDADYVLMESVYGDKNHEPEEERVPKLRALVIDAMERGGVLMIPAFSIERTQHMLYEISNLMKSGEIPRVPVFLDSPLAIAVTEIYKKYGAEYFKTGVQRELVQEGDIFNFPMLKKTRDREESDALKNVANPKIIIAGAGMSHGGRIQKHERLYLCDPRSTLLLVGYQAAGSLGRRLQDGAREVEINGTRVPVRAEIRTLTGFSAHKDRDHLIEFVSHTSEKVKKVFVTMGERKASLFLVQRLREYLGVEAVVLEEGERVALT